MDLVLASRSPQRTAILHQLGIPHTIRPADVDEMAVGDPVAVAAANALAKTLAVPLGDGETVLGVDTVVALDGEIFGKPVHAAHAAATLARLQGRTHEVLSGLAVAGLVPGGGDEVGQGMELREALAVTRVTFRELNTAQIDAYVATGEWNGRAGGYAIQERGGALVRALDGDYLNVVGLPVAALLDLVPGLLPH
jgi:septum formation protein